MTIILVTLFIILIIYLLWFYENYLPNIKCLENESQNIDCIDQWLKILNKKGKFNGGILYKEKGNIVLMNTYGFTNHKKVDYLNNNSKFRLASLSKQFTAFGIMLLVKNKVLNYDDLVSTIIPEFPYPKVTIKNLLNQTSGISSSYISIAKKRVHKKNYILSNKDAVDLICKYPDKEIKNPDEFYLYNNSNYILLARIIEILSNSSFEEFMKSNVFIPLELKDTIVWNLLSNTNSIDSNSLTYGFESYLNSKPIEIKPSWIDGVAGDGAIFSSLEDLSKWDDLLYKNGLIDSSELSKAFKTPTLNNGEKSNYGFGWVIDGNIVWHNGKWLASNTFIIRNLENKKCLVLLDNSSNLRFNKIVTKLNKHLKITTNE